MKKGLVLEGGGMRGLFSAGVLDFFLENNIQFDEVIGVSAGACNACNFISKQKYRSRDVWVNYAKDKKYCSIKNLRKTGDIFNIDYAWNKIPNELNKFDYETFKNSKTKMTAVATDIKTGKAKYFRVNDLKGNMDIIRASSSLPVIFNKVLINKHYYLDGGLSDPIPIRKIEKNNEKIVVILTRSKNYRKKKNKSYLVMKKFYKDYPNLINDTENRYLNYNNTLDYLADIARLKKAFIIRPRKELKIKRLEKNQKKLIKVYNEGYSTAEDCYNDLLSYLKS